jgi:threonine synthase
MWGTAVTEAETRNTISEVHRKYGLLLEPHGAVAWKGLELFQLTNAGEITDSDIMVSLETAHPAKFNGEIQKILGITPPLPPSLEIISSMKEEYYDIENNYETLREFILEFKK